MEMKDESDELPAEYLPEPLDLTSPSLAGFVDVFARFQLPVEESKVSHFLHYSSSLSNHLRHLGERHRNLQRRNYLLR